MVVNLDLSGVKGGRPTKEEIKRMQKQLDARKKDPNRMPRGQEDIEELYRILREQGLSYDEARRIVRDRILKQEQAKRMRGQPPNVEVTLRKHS